MARTLESDRDVPGDGAGSGKHRYHPDLRSRIRLLVIAIIALSLLVASAFIQDSNGHPLGWGQPTFWASLLRDLAVAFIIAIAVGIAIEATARDELQQRMEDGIEAFRRVADSKLDEIARDVFSGVLVRRYPEPLGQAISSEIEALVLRSDFIRLDHSSVFRMKVIEIQTNDSSPAKKRVVEVAATITYEVLNIAHRARDYEISVLLEDPSVGPIVKKPMTIKEIKVDNVPLQIDVLEDTEGVLRFRHCLKDIASGQKRKVSISFTMIKGLDDYEIWTSIVPSDGMRLIVYFPRELNARGAFEIHREALDAQWNGMESADLRLRGPVLPEQGMVLWWRCS
jgi:hypothetical protein